MSGKLYFLACIFVMVNSMQLTCPLPLRATLYHLFKSLLCHTIFFSQGFKVETGFVQTNVRIQWNSVYKAFHQIGLCGNERSGS